MMARVCRDGSGSLDLTGLYWKFRVEKQQKLPGQMCPQEPQRLFAQRGKALHHPLVCDGLTTLAFPSSAGHRPAGRRDVTRPSRPDLSRERVGLHEIHRT